MKKRKTKVTTMQDIISKSKANECNSIDHKRKEEEKKGRYVSIRPFNGSVGNEPYIFFTTVYNFHGERVKETT